MSEHRLWLGNGNHPDIESPELNGNPGCVAFFRKWLLQEQSSLRLWQQVPDPVATSEMVISLAHPRAKLGNGCCGTSHTTTSGKVGRGSSALMGVKR